MPAPRPLAVASALFLAAACGPSAGSTPPLYAPRPAGEQAEAAPAHRLPDDTHPLHYALDLELAPERTTYRGEVRIDLALDRPRDAIYLHAKGLRASSVRVVRPDAEVVTGTLDGLTPSGLSAVRLAQPVGPGPVRLEIAFEAEFGTKLSGLYRAASGGAHYAFTQFESISAREAFPCLDEPRFKTPFDVTLRVPEGDVAIANTRELDSQKVTGGLRAVRFATTEKLPTYLIAFAVGPFDVVSAPDLPPTAERTRPLPLRAVAVKGRGKDLAFALRETPALLTALERYFAIGYPYDKLDLIAVPDFGAGAMENAGAITFRDTLLLVADDAPESQRRAFASVQAHELAHQWFGDLVTMPWWDDLWLNEAFATWMATRIIEEVHPEHHANLGEVSYAHYAMDVDSRVAARQIRQPIESDHDIENAFDAITYSKGGAVLAMFERYLGKEHFRDGLRLYMKRHAFANASARDLTAALGEAAKNPGVSAAFGTFLEQPGVPLVSAEVTCGETPSLALSQQRYLPLGSPGQRASTWQVPVCARLGDAAGAREQCTLLSAASATVPLEGACPAWLMPNAGAAGYYRYSLSSASLTALLAARANLGPSERMSLVANVDAAMRAGELGADASLPAVLGLVDDGERLVIEGALRALSLASDQLLDAETRPLLQAELARRLRPAFAQLGLFPQAGESSDGETKLRRALLTRALAFSARDPALLAELAKLGDARLGLGDDPRAATLPSEVIELSLAAAVQVGGPKTIDRALERAFASQDGLERSRLLGAVASQKDPAVTERVMALALDERLRTNERYIPLMSQHGQPETRAAAYAWLKAHIAPLREVLGEHGAAAIISAVNGLCSEEDAVDVERTFSAIAPDIMGGPRHLAMALENIRLCAAVRGAQSEKARAGLRQLAASVPVEKPAKPRKGQAAGR